MWSNHNYQVFIYFFEFIFSKIKKKRYVNQLNLKNWINWKYMKKITYIMNNKLINTRMHTKVGTVSKFTYSLPIIHSFITPFSISWYNLIVHTQFFVCKFSSSPSSYFTVPILIVYVNNPFTIQFINKHLQNIVPHLKLWFRIWWHWTDSHNVLIHITFQTS